jgi:hypothetical protein
MRALRLLRVLLALTDLGFLAYWAVTLLHVLPEAYLFKDYRDPLVVAWNWSFLPLDLAVSATGLASLWLERRANPRWPALALVSLTLTSCSGLMALAFWTLRRDFDLTWWLPNAFLLLYPLAFFGPVMRAWAATASPATTPPAT